MRAQPFKRVDPGNSRQVLIEDQTDGLGRKVRIQKGFGAPRTADEITGGPQRESKRGPQGGVVLDEDDARQPTCDV